MVRSVVFFSFKMANVRDSDTSLWLHNKLGTSNDSWTGGSICTQLNNEVLRNIKDCFPDLQTQVKLKLLLSFFHIPRRNVEEWRPELEEILEIASLDSELWVSMLAEIMKTLPSSGSLNSHRPREMDETRPVFSDMITDLKKFLNRHEEQLHLLPLECHYLNKAALTSVVGQQPNPVKHFTLKRKPKSAALRAELLQKCADAMSNMKKSVAPTVPIRSRGMPRKMTDTTPLKGLPSRWSLGRGGIRTPARPAPPPTARKDGGIKLLDIADQPATIHQKKRRKLLEAEEQQQQKKAAAEAEAAAAPQAAATTGGPAQAGALPEYARGLNNYVMPSTPQDQGLPPLSTAQSPAVTPVTPTAGQTSPSTPLTPTSPHPLPAPTITSPTIQVSSTQIASNQATTTLTGKHPIIIQQTPPTAGQKTTGIVIQQQPKLLITGQGQKPLLVTAGPGGTLLSGQNVLKTSTGVPVIFANSSVLQQNQQGQAILTQQGGKTVLLTNVKQVNSNLVQQGGNVIIQTQQVAGNPPGLVISNPVGIAQQANQTIQAQQQNAAATPAGQDANAAQRAQQQQAGNLLPRRGLTLTREQMIEAQDMFKNANRVTRPEKALILGFMAGSRENPCPNLGNIVTIKLSENPENVRQADNTYLLMLCETHFQMNYNNGQWMRIKKLRPIEGAVPQPIPQHIS